MIKEIPKKGKRICPVCDGEDVVKSGKKRLKGGSTTQRYQCKRCGTTFSESRHGYFKSKFPLALKQYAIALYVEGLSLEKVKNKLWEDLSIKVSSQAIMRWLERAGVERRPRSSGDQKNKIVREHIKIGVTTLIRFVSSERPEKLLILTDQVSLK